MYPHLHIARSPITDISVQGTLGAPLKSGLERAYPGNFALQGVEYPADLASNFLPLGSGQDSIDEMARLITDVATKCPSAKIAAGGYRYFPPPALSPASPAHLTPAQSRHRRRRALGRAAAC